MEGHRHLQDLVAEVLKDLSLHPTIDATGPALHVLEEEGLEVPNLSQQGRLLEEEGLADHHLGLEGPVFEGQEVQVEEPPDKYNASQEPF